jgi:hypothetical protein
MGLFVALSIRINVDTMSATVYCVILTFVIFVIMLDADVLNVVAKGTKVHGKPHAISST